jgi:hypothetical protein
MNHEAHDEHAIHVRLVVRVLQGLTAATTFDSYADVKEALKIRLARLGISYDTGVVVEALDRLELGGRRRLVEPLPRRRELVERPIEPDPIDKATALRIVEALKRRGIA